MKMLKSKLYELELANQIAKKWNTKSENGGDIKLEVM